MKSKTMILMVIAIVCGLGASYMTSRLLAERNEKVIVLVPKQKLSQWTHIKEPETMFEEREILKRSNGWRRLQLLIHNTIPRMFVVGWRSG